MKPEKKQIANDARSWWNGIISEAAIISALQYSDYDVVIPENTEVIGVDYSGGTDFLAHKDGKVFAIDAKSSAGRGGRGYSVMADPRWRIGDAVKGLSERHFGDAPIIQSTVTVDPLLLSPLPREDDPAKQIKNIRNFLTLPGEVESGFISELSSLPLPKGV